MGAGGGAEVLNSLSVALEYIETEASKLIFSGSKYLVKMNICFKKIRHIDFNNPIEIGCTKKIQNCFDFDLNIYFFIDFLS